MFFTVETKGFSIWAIFRISSPFLFLLVKKMLAAFISSLFQVSRHKEKKRVNLIQFQITFEMEELRE